MNELNISDGKKALIHGDMIYITQDRNTVQLRRVEAEKLKRWLNEAV